MSRRAITFPATASAITVAVLSVVSVCAIGCDEGPPKAYIDISLLTPAGESPLDGIDTLAVTVRQGVDAPQVAMGTVTADGFSLELPIVDFARPVDIAVELTGGTTRLLGGAPTLIPAETGTVGDGSGLVVIAVGPPRSCAIVDGMVITDPRAHAAVSQQGTFAAVVGGETTAGPSGAAAYLDLVRLGVHLDPDENQTLDNLMPIGRAIGFPINKARSLVISEHALPFLYDITGACPDGVATTCAVVPAPPELHTASNLNSAVAPLRHGGVVVVGGGEAGAPSDDVSWIDGDGNVQHTLLVTPRTAASAIELAGSGERVLVAGGETDGEPFAEIIVREAPVGSTVMGARPGPARVGGALFSDGGDGALFVGGTDGATTPITETVRITACDARCALAPGPLFSRARVGAYAAPRRSGGGLLLGGDGPDALVDEVRFDADGTAHIEPHADLTTPRADATPLVLPNGITFIVGGLGLSGPLGDVEVCFPETVALP